VNIKLEVSGWNSYSAARNFLDALAKIAGVRRVHEEEFRGGVLFAEIAVDREVAKELARWLEILPALKPFGIVVETSSGAKIAGVVRK
jgi:hypothetical protein